MPTTNYSILTVMREALRGHTGWRPAWRNPEPQKQYDVVIIGGGGPLSVSARDREQASRSKGTSAGSA